MGALTIVTTIIVLLLSSARRVETPEVGADPEDTPEGEGHEPSGDQRDRQELNDYARALESALEWPGLAAFLDATALRESGWNASIRNKVDCPTQNPSDASCKRNHARGAYQVRPRSGFPSSGMFKGKFATREFPEGYDVQHGELLLDPLVNTAAIVSYLTRSGSGPARRNATWENVRLSMAFPRYMGGPRDDDPADIAKYNKGAEKFANALDSVGVGRGFAQQPANLPKRMGVREVYSRLRSLGFEGPELP